MDNAQSGPQTTGGLSGGRDRSQIDSMVMGKVISAAAMKPLEDALSTVFWFKDDLRTFLDAALRLPGVVSKLQWSAYKRVIVHQLVSLLFENQHRYGDELTELMLAVSELDNPAS